MKTHTAAAAAATVGGKKQQTLRTTLKMRDIHFSTSSRVVTWGEGGAVQGHVDHSDLFWEEIQLASPTIGPVPGQLLGGRETFA